MSFESSKQKQSNLSALFSTDVKVLTYDASPTLDFHDGVSQTMTISGAIALDTTNRGSGKFLTLRVVDNGSGQNITYASGWKWLSDSGPSTIAASKTGILSLTCYGTAESDIVAVWAVES